MILPKMQSRGGARCGEGHEGIYLITDEYYMEKAWLPSLLGEVELGRKKQVSGGVAQLEVFSG